VDTERVDPGSAPRVARRFILAALLTPESASKVVVAIVCALPLAASPSPTR
jgi:hypothetical protein